MLRADGVERPQPDDSDLRIVHALQIHPRAPWQLVGDVLGLDPATVARRWARLEQAGIAWVHAAPAPAARPGVVGAWLEVSTASYATDIVAAALAGEATVVSLRRVTGDRDLIALLSETEFAALGDLVNDQLAAVPGVLATRTHVITGSPLLGSDWRLDRLEPSEAARLRAEQDDAEPRQPGDDVDESVIAVLRQDGRASVRQIAQTVGISTATAARRLRGLLAGPAVHLHCDVTRDLSGFPVSALYFGSLPAEHLARAVSLLRDVPEIRICTTVTGPANLVIDVWLRTVSAVHTLEALICTHLGPLGYRVHDRCVALRSYKHHGRLIDRSGRAAAAGSAPG